MSKSYIKSRSDRVLLLERAEPRLLLSADPVSTMLSVAMDYADELDNDSIVSLDQLTLTAFPQPASAHSAENLMPSLSAADVNDASDMSYPPALSSANEFNDAADSDLGSDISADLNADLSRALNETTSVTELIIVDSRVEDAATLLEGINSNDDAITLFINPDKDGIDSITTALSEYSGIETIHLISHGDDGELQLGSSLLSSDTLNQYADQLSSWQASLTDDADILLYGCNVAQTSDGEAFVQALAGLTSADIAASDDLTGHETLSGDWQLEYQVGQIDSVISVDLATQQSWTGVLAGNLWISTDGDVSGEIDPFLPSAWGNSDVLDFEPAPLIGYGSTTSTLEIVTSVFDIETFTDNTNVDAIHYVTTDISVGSGTSIDLQSGDVLLSLSSDKTLTSTNSLSVKDEDVFIFRPDVAGDYSAGTFSLLFSNPSGKDLKGITLVEETTIVGDTSLQAGSFLFTVTGDGSGDYGIYTFDPGDLTVDPADGVVTTLVDGTEEDIFGDDIFPDKPVGIELVENDYSVGGVDLEAGTILLTFDGDNGVAGLGERQDVLAVNLTQTTLVSGSTDGTVSLFFDGSDIGLTSNVQSLNAITFTDFQGPATVNASPTGSLDINGTLTEDQTLTLDVSSLDDADGLGSFSYQWQRDGVTIADATGDNYTLVAADVGASISALVSYTDGGGTQEVVMSASTGLVTVANDPISGLPQVNGSTMENQQLTANTSGISDANGLSNSFTYQWQRSADGITWSDISGATSDTYILDDPDVGQYMRVSVSITDDDGFDEGPLFSSAVGTINSVNDSIVGLPSISGTASEDETLTADISAISDPDGLSNSFNYQWQRSADGVTWSDISGATSSTYTLDDPDVGQQIRVSVSITDDQGFNEGPLNSAATAAVTAVNDPIAGLPSISGTATEDETLTADISAISDPDGLSNSFSYQWQRSADGFTWSDITGATGNTYMLDDPDVGQQVRVSVSITDDQGFDEGPLYSTATAAVITTNDPITGLPSITGTATEDETLTADISAISDVDGLSNSFSYQWQRSADGVTWSDISGATSSTYTLDDPDVGQQIRVNVSITDDQGFDEGPLNSAATSAVTAVNDPIVGLPSISGTATEDETLTADISAISDPDGLSSSFSYQWQRSADGVTWSDISGATSSTYTLDDPDVGQQVRVSVSITDDQSFDEGPLNSAATAAVAGINDPITGLPSISGTATEDETLTADISAISDPDGLSSSFSYQWQRSADGVTWSDITGATGNTYMLDDPDVGQQVRVSVSITDDQSFDEGPLNSAATAAVITTNDPITGLPSITGTATEDETLTADISAISDVDGLSNSFSYQWQRSVDGVTWSDITGATGNSYTLDDPDVGQQVRVSVSITDDQGFDEGPLNSAATAAVTAINDAYSGSLSIGGNVAVGERLTLNNTISDPDGIDVITYQWYRDGVMINGATNQDYLLTGSDIGKEVYVVAEYIDQQGFAESATSNMILLTVTEPEQDTIVTPDADVEGDDNGEIVAVQDPLVSQPSPPLVTVTADSDGVVIVNQPVTFVIDTAYQDSEPLSVNTLDKAIARQINTLQFESLLNNMIQPLALQDIDQFIKGIEQLQTDARYEHALNTTLVGGSVALSSGLSVGYVIWLARSGVLLSTVLTSLPAWRFIDPMPILSTYSTEEDEYSQDFEDDHESLDSMVKSDAESLDDSEDEDEDEEDDSDKRGSS
ncbi:DUF4347 domain-containing protein [Amphritea sp. 1_MG-2023]|uniref:DUF4347 domain-containing protein n=1 Tax=Amphritea sp. 1_MG-2023 TaxID=3062670 RepID=UPI0026E17592|nr:DUF4347 domain-containing protein [Amphritea sp. 1_MG-2023]MDO6563310.1 DUF4347 domain-containing protein [Amphritea sp. 1_MG-2023]